MTDEEKIAGAAEIIVTEEARRGGFISLPEATHLAKLLYEFWTHKHDNLELKPGDIAKHFRERYQEVPEDLGEAE